MQYEIPREMFENLADDWSLELREDYSGRGMYGQTCPGLVGGMSNFCGFLVDISIRLSESVFGADPAFELADHVATDNMGWDTIFYFPGLELVDYDNDY